MSREVEWFKNIRNASTKRVYDSIPAIQPPSRNCADWGIQETGKELITAL